MASNKWNLNLKFQQGSRQKVWKKSWKGFIVIAGRELQKWEIPVIRLQIKKIKTKKIMKKNNSMQRKVPYRVGAVVAFVLMAFLFSCKKDETAIGLGPAMVRITLKGSLFGGAGELNPSTKVQGKTVMAQSISDSLQNTPVVQRREVSLGNGMTLVAELTAQNTMVDQRSAAAAAGSIETTPLNYGTRIKLVVFDDKGDYVTERDYINGCLCKTLSITLDGGKTYTFIAYSFNDQTDLPELSFRNNIKTLVNAQTSAYNSYENSTAFNYKGLMYFKKQLTVSGSNVNYLDIVLTHRFSQVTTRINTNKMNGPGDKKIYDVDAWFTPHYPLGIMDLTDGKVTESGAMEGAPIVFTEYEGFQLTSYPSFINAETTTGKLEFKYINIGGVEKYNLPPITGLLFKRGQKYTLTVNLKDSE